MPKNGKPFPLPVAVKMHRQGATLEAISEVVGYSVKSVWVHLRAAGFDASKHNAKFDRALRRRVLQYRDNMGLTFAEIGRRIGTEAKPLSRQWAQKVYVQAKAEQEQQDE